MILDQNNQSQAGEGPEMREKEWEEKRSEEIAAHLYVCAHMCARAAITGCHKQQLKQGECIVWQF